LGALPGVAKVAYDCKTATVTMKKEGTLTKDAAGEALAKKGFKLTRFEAGPESTSAVYLFRAEGGAPSEIEGLLRDRLSDAQGVLVDGAGRALVRMKPGKAASERTIAGALEEKGVRVAAFETKEWPASPASYSIALGGGNGSGAGEAVRGILQDLDKVLAALVFEEGRAARIFLREPCDRIESSARAALEGKGFAVAKFERLP
jgi:hypothetical protein